MMTTTPPTNVIERARQAAMASPCGHSKRGSVVYRHEYPMFGRVFGVGWNHPPAPMICDNSVVCHVDCSVLCVHAEDAALLEGVPKAAEVCIEPEQLSIVHVKVIDGVIVPGGAPSCVYCSKQILEVRIGVVWLYELSEHPLAVRGRWKPYNALEFHQASLRNTGRPSAAIRLGVRATDR